MTDPAVPPAINTEANVTAETLISSIDAPLCDVRKGRCRRAAAWSLVSNCGHAQAFACNYHQRLLGSLIRWAKASLLKLDAKPEEPIVECKTCGADLVDFRWVRL